MKLDSTATRPAQKEWAHRLEQFRDAAASGYFYGSRFEQALCGAAKLQKNRAIDASFDELLAYWELHPLSERLTSEAVSELQAVLRARHDDEREQRLIRIAQMRSKFRSEEMTDEEYRIVLEDIATEYVDLNALKQVVTNPSALDKACAFLSERARTLRTSATSLDPILEDIPTAGEHFRTFSQALEATGVSAALDAYGGVVRRELRELAIPKEDEVILARCGYEDVRAAIVTTLAATRYLAKVPTTKETFDEVQDALGELASNEGATAKKQRSSDNSSNDPAAKESNPSPRRRLFGVGRLLTAGAVIAGNLWLASLVVKASTPLLTAKAEASSVVACAALTFRIARRGLHDLLGARTE